jgi:CBS domain containing-hemolysin-like protein
VTWPIVLGFVTLMAMVASLGFSETVLAQMGVNRLRKLLAGDNGYEEFTSDEQVRLLTTILVLRLLSILALGGLVILATLELVQSMASELAIIFCTGLLMVLVDTIARRHARYRAAAAASTVLTFFRRVNVLFSPLVSLIFLLTSPFSPGQAPSPMATLDDLQDEVLNLRSQGLLKETQTELFQSLLEFGETIAREVMVPRVDMICCPLGMPAREVLQLMNEHGYSRVPVYKEDIDSIVGFVHVKDLIVDLGQTHRPITEDDLRAVLVVPGTKKVGEILRDFQAQNRAMAVVLDEYGGTDGLLTVEDIVEEIVGDINDEYDKEVAEIEHLTDGSALVDGAMIVEDVNEHLDLDIPTEGSETLGGYLYEMFGHAPQIGESVLVDGVRFAVEGVQRKRITWVRIEKLDRLESAKSHKYADEKERVA